MVRVITFLNDRRHNSQRCISIDRPKVTQHCELCHAWRPCGKYM